MAAKSAASTSAATRHDRMVETVRLLMGQRVEHRVDAERVSIRTEIDEVGGVIALAFPGIAVVGVVRHQHNHPALLVDDGTRVRGGAVGAALRGAPGAKEEIDRWNL